MSTNQLNTHTPQKPIPKIQQKPSANYIQFKPVNLNPSPNKPTLIAARPLAPLLPATAQPVAIQSKPTSVKKPKNDNLLIQQQQQQHHPKISQQGSLTQEQLNQIAAALQPKPNASNLPPLPNGQYYQFIPIQPNGVKLQQPLIIAPVQPQHIQPAKNSTIQPKPQPNPIMMSDGQIGQFIFQTVPNTNKPNPTNPTQAVVQPVQHQLNTTTNNIQLLQQRLAEEEQRQDQLLKQLNERQKKLNKKSPEKKPKTDEMEVDTEPNETENKTNETETSVNTNVQNKKRGRPRLYAVDASTGKSIKGKLLNDRPPKPPKMVLQPQLQLSNGFTIYPSPSTSTSSSYSQPNFIINQPGQLVNTQFIPLNIVQPMVQEDNKTEESDEEMEDDVSEKAEENSEKENIEVVVQKPPTPEPAPPEPEPEPVKVVDTLKNLKSQVVLTHVIDGFVIKESSKPFPVKPIDTVVPVPHESSPNTTSTPSSAEITEKLNNSRLEDQSLNTSSQSQKGKRSKPNTPNKKPKKSTGPNESMEQEKNYSFQNTSPQFNSTIMKEKEEWPQGDPTEWNCEQVYRFVCLVTGQQVAEMFRTQEVDGSALSLIRDDHLVNTMGVKLGPALKIMSKFNELNTKFKSQSM